MTPTHPPPDEIDTGWDDASEPESFYDPALRASPPETGGVSADVDSGWDEIDAPPAVTPKSRSERELPLQAVDAGWDEEDPSEQIVPERGQRPATAAKRKALARPPVASRPAAPVASKLLPLTKKQRRELERKQRLQLAELKAERKEQKRLERQEQQRQLLEQRGAVGARASTASAPALSRKKKAKPSASEERRAPPSQTSLQAARTPHSKAPSTALLPIGPSTQSKTKRSRAKLEKPGKGASSEASNFGRISLFVLFVLLVAAAAFAFTR